MIIPLLFACETAPEPQGPASGDTGAGWNGVVYLVAEDDPSSVEMSAILDASATATISEDGMTLDGEMRYRVVRGGITNCDITIGLTGTAVSGVCEDCDFAFKVDPEVTEYRSDFCDPSNGYTLLPDGVHGNTHLAFAESYPIVSAITHDIEVYHDVMMVGYSADYRSDGGGYYPGPYWGWLSWDGPYSDLGWADLDGATLRWGDFYEEIARFDNHYAFCYTAIQSDATAAYGGEMVSGELDCVGTLMDGWGFVAEAGQEVTVSVDTPDPDAEFAPVMFVNGPDGCAVVRAQENFLCTSDEDPVTVFAPQCSSARFVAEQSGPHEVWIHSPGEGCLMGTTVTYELSVDVR